MNCTSFTIFNSKSISLSEYGYSDRYIMFSNGEIYDTKKQ